MMGTGTTDYFDKELINEKEAQRKILLSELEILKSFLKKYESGEDWSMFAYVLQKYNDYLELSYMLDLLRVDEYIKMKVGCYYE